MSQNGGHQFYSCMQPHHWRMETPAKRLRKPKNSHQWGWLRYNKVAKGYLTRGRGKRVQGVNGGMASKVEWPENDSSGMLPVLAHCSSWPSLCNAPFFFFTADFLDYFDLNMETTSSFQTTVTVYCLTWHHMPESWDLYQLLHDTQIL